MDDQETKEMVRQEVCVDCKGAVLGCPHSDGIRYCSEFNRRYRELKEANLVHTPTIDDTRHAGDCTIYVGERDVARPWDGVCTCGCGWRYLRQTGGDDRHMLAPWKRNRMEANDEE